MKMDRFKTIFDEFIAWVLGIEEEDPLDPEIAYIYFILSFDGGINSLQYAGVENKTNQICSFDYFPLEAQFFHSNNFLSLTNEEAKDLSKIFVQQLIDNQSGHELFQGREVSLIISNKVEYSIKVK